ncbi:TPA: hypothetical protein ACGW3M_001114 [Pseudomonas aeruginosa]|uniref:hypothetical protein n=1 Tax=Pseudomonas aeruginosa TaxID=287 RepID=UPI0027EE3ED4|nr:hypothetical protein [Pseudomonas aeruginosa]ELJ2278773.1 hypothetical protein [Pseudomonas aeruginosa]
MKRAWIDLSTVPMPDRVARLPRDERGYPTPHFAMFIDGKPDFRRVDHGKWFHAIESRQCGICGGSLGAHIAFVGGPSSMQSKLFTDLPMHRDCARYALQVCPFMAAPKFAYSNFEKEGVRVNPHVSDQRPERFGLAMTKAYRLVQLPGQSLALQAGDFVSVEWWLNGKPVEATSLS